MPEDEGVCVALLKGGESLAVVNLTAAGFSCIQSKAECTGQSLGEFLKKTAETMVAKEQKASKIPSGFVMVNLSSSDQKELRAMAREVGMPLNKVLRNTLRNMRFFLKEQAKLKRLTGSAKWEQFTPGLKLN